MDDNQPEMSRVNYDLLMERIKQQDEAISALKKQNDDIIAFNRQLLNTSEPQSNRVSKAERHAELGKLIKEAFK